MFTRCTPARSSNRSRSPVEAVTAQKPMPPKTHRSPGRVIAAAGGSGTRSDHTPFDRRRVHQTQHLLAGEAGDFQLTSIFCKPIAWQSVSLRPDAENVAVWLSAIR